MVLWSTKAIWKPIEQDVHPTVMTTLFPLSNLTITGFHSQSWIITTGGRSAIMVEMARNLCKTNLVPIKALKAEMRSAIAWLQRGGHSNEVILPPGLTITVMEISAQRNDVYIIIAMRLQTHAWALLSLSDSELPSGHTKLLTRLPRFLALVRQGTWAISHTSVWMALYPNVESG